MAFGRVAVVASALVVALGACTSVATPAGPPGRAGTVPSSRDLAACPPDHQYADPPEGPRLAPGSWIRVPGESIRAQTPIRGRPVDAFGWTRDEYDDFYGVRGSPIEVHARTAELLGAFRSRIVDAYLHDTARVGEGAAPGTTLTLIFGAIAVLDDGSVVYLETCERVPTEIRAVAASRGVSEREVLADLEAPDGGSQLHKEAWSILYPRHASITRDDAGTSTTMVPWDRLPPEQRFYDDVDLSTERSVSAAGTSSWDVTFAAAPSGNARSDVPALVCSHTSVAWNRCTVLHRDERPPSRTVMAPDGEDLTFVVRVNAAPVPTVYVIGTLTPEERARLGKSITVEVRWTDGTLVEAAASGSVHLSFTTTG